MGLHGGGVGPRRAQAGRARVPRMEFVWGPSKAVLAHPNFVKCFIGAHIIKHMSLGGAIMGCQPNILIIPIAVKVKKCLSDTGLGSLE